MPYEKIHHFMSAIMLG